MTEITELSFNTVTSLWKSRDLIFKAQSLDMSSITKIDAAGIAFLVKWAKSLQSKKQNLIHVPTSAMNLISTYKLEEIFKVEN